MRRYIAAAVKKFEDSFVRTVAYTGAQHTVCDSTLAHTMSRGEN